MDTSRILTITTVLLIAMQGSTPGTLATRIERVERGRRTPVIIEGDETWSIEGRMEHHKVPGLSIAAANDWEDYLRPPRKRIDLPATLLEAFSGRYKVSDDDACVITVEGTRVVGRPLIGECIELVPISNDTLVRRDQPSTYSIEIAPDSKKDSLTIRTEEESVTAARLAEIQRLPVELLIDRTFDEASTPYRKLTRRSPESELVAESRFNTIGYRLLGRGEVNGALAIFELNVEYYPNAFNTYDSLGEALVTRGDRNRAIQNYKRPLELNPRNTNAIQMLKRLDAQ